MRNNVKKISITAIFTAMILVATAYIKLPLAMGYVHAGDIFIIISCFFLPMYLAIPCVAVSSMLADLLAGYVPYMLVTLFAKGVLAVFCRLGLYEKQPKLWKMILFPTIGSFVMVSFYFVFEGFYYGWAAAIANLPAQFIQPAIALPIAIIGVFAFSKIQYLLNFRALMARNPAKRKMDYPVIDAKQDNKKDLD
jgi:uncharacterized membrane protein